MQITKRSHEPWFYAIKDAPEDVRKTLCQYPGVGWDGYNRLLIVPIDVLRLVFKDTLSGVFDA